MRNILVISNTGYELFTSLKPFFVKYPQFEEYRNRINEAFSRKKENVYTIEDFTILRLNVQT